MTVTKMIIASQQWCWPSLRGRCLCPQVDDDNDDDDKNVENNNNEENKTKQWQRREWPSQRGRCLCPQVVVPPSPPSFDPLLEAAPAGDDDDDDDGDDGDDDDNYGDDDDDGEWLLLSKSILCSETWMRKPILNDAGRIFPINISSHSLLAPKTKLVRGLQACIWKGCNQLI